MYKISKRLLFGSSDYNKRSFATAVCENLKLKGRAELMSCLTEENRELDILIIGGGATGTGAALEAARRGLRVACVEKEDIASGTSSRSTKLIWGGSRYLVQAFVSLFSSQLLKAPKVTLSKFIDDFRMVLNCHRERTFLLQKQPHLTSWLPIAVPLSNWIQWPPPFGFPLASLGPLGLFPLFFKFYDALSGFSCPPSHVMTPTRARRKFPQLAHHLIKYCSVFYEGTHDDARTNMAIALTAVREGAIVVNYCEVISLTKKGDEDPGCVDPETVVGAWVQDRVGGSAFIVRAKSVLLCGGPFTDALRTLEDPDRARAVTGASGTHIVLPGYFAPAAIGLVDMNTSDGRFLFFLPWNGHVLVGTTDHKCEPSMRPMPAEEEIQWLLTEASKYIAPELQLRRQDVLSAWSGVRPLASDPSGGDTAAVSRDHVVSLNRKSGVVFVAGGKWTTYREMAEDAVDMVVKSNDKLGAMRLRASDTLTTALVGFEGYSINLERVLIQQYGITADVAARLARAYGGRAHAVLAVAKEMAAAAEAEQPQSRDLPLLVRGYPYLKAEVVFAARYEWAVHAEDVLARRTRLAFLNKEAAIQAIPLVVKLMGDELMWSEDQRRTERNQCIEFLRHFGGPKVALTDMGVRGRLAVRIAARADLRDVFDKVSVQERVGPVELQLAGELLNHPLTQEEVADCLRHSQCQTSFSASLSDLNEVSSVRVTFGQFETWWNSDRLNPGLVDMRASKSVTAGSVEGSGTLFG